MKKAGKKASKEGIITIEAKRYRSQEKNKQDALFRLVKLVKMAAEVKRKRIKTKPTKISLQKRIESKEKKSEIKKMRQKIKTDL